MRRCAFLILATITLLAIMPRPAAAALSMPHSWRKVSDDGQYVLVIVSPLPVKDDVGYFMGWPAGEKQANDVRDIRARYSQSGMYRNDGSTTPVWTTWYYLPPTEVFISPDGQQVTLVSDWVEFFGSADRGTSAVRFLERGRELADIEGFSMISNYMAKSLVHRIRNFFSRISGDGWGISLARPSSFDPRQRTVTLHIHGGEALTFDMTTGKLIRHWSPWPYYLAGIVAVLVAIPLGILLNKASRRSLWGIVVTLASLNLLANVIAVATIDVSRWYSLVALGALVLSQMGLIAIWAGLGDSRALPRLAVALALFLLWAYVGAIPGHNDLRVVPMQITVVACLLQLLRIGGFRWAHVRRQDNADWMRLGRWQFSLKGLLTWSFVIAICLGLNRFVPARYLVEPREWIGAIPVILITLLSAWAVLGNGRICLRIGGLLLVAPLLYPALFVIWKDFKFFDIDLMGPSPDYWEVFMLSLVGGLEALLLIGMLAIFRRRGYRLLQAPAAEPKRTLQSA